MNSEAARIRVARRAKELTQSDVADLLGVGRSAVAQWERRDGSKPNVSHLTHLAQVLDCSFEWLATGRGPRELKKASDGGAETAVQLRHFASDDDEERLLSVFRPLEDDDRQLVLSLAEGLHFKAIAKRRKPKPTRSVR